MSWHCLDIKGAYENVIPEILSKVLNDIELPHDFLDL